MDHSLSYFKTCNSDDSACEAKESCGKLHHFAKKESLPKRKTFKCVQLRGRRAGADDRIRTGDLRLTKGYLKLLQLRIVS